MGMMTGNNQADDVPMAMNHNLVKGVLRDEYGFRGIAMTDWQNSQYHPMRQHLILTSGMSLMMPDNGAFMKYIDEEVAKSP